jgi:hypothetical protein
MTTDSATEVAKLEKILTQEIPLLEELITLCLSLCDIEAPSVDEVQKAFDCRDKISKELEALETEAAAILAVVGSVPETLRSKADTLIERSGEAQNAQEKMSTHLASVLELLKKDTVEVAKAKRSIRGYGGPVSHLSRFSDRKG